MLTSSYRSSKENLILYLYWLIISEILCRFAANFREMQNSEMFFKLLRAAMQGQTLTDTLTDETWNAVYVEAQRQSVLGLLYGVAGKMSLPFDLACQWASEAETIRGLNQLFDSEAKRLTQLFAEAGHKSVILKGQANALLYPVPNSRQPGDIDIWVEGGRASVVAMLTRMGMMDGVAPTAAEGKATASYHHVHLPANEKGVTVEVHFRPASGNYNPVTNRRLQRWLEREILSAQTTERGFCVPSVRFALVMQLAHIQRHFFSEGVGLRQLCDYYWLLQHSTAADREEVAALVGRFGLAHTAKALMWVLGKVFHLAPQLMFCKQDSTRGRWLLHEVMEGGNFGVYAPWQQHEFWRWVFEKRWRRTQLLKFDFGEMLWLDICYWMNIVRTLPTRIKYRKLSLRDIPA